MNKLIALGFIAGLSVSAAQALPLVPSLGSSSSVVIKVAGGCGAGFHRGPGGGCLPNGGAVVVAPGAVVVAPVTGPCGGRGQHRVCGVDGRCVMACN
jgi:hypothetical protein